MSWGSDRGTVTAELAIAVPALLGIVGVGLGALRWGMDAVNAVSMATESSIAIGRGGAVDDVQSRLNSANALTHWTITIGRGGACVTGQVGAPFGFLPPITIVRCANT